MIITHNLKTTLSILCTVSFLSGCIATQKVKIDDGNKSSREVIKNVEPLPPRAQLTSRESPSLRKKRQSNTQLQEQNAIFLSGDEAYKKGNYAMALNKVVSQSC
jgi:hypothetical protein